MRKQIAIAVSMIAMLLTFAVGAAGQQPASLVASAGGEGKIKLGNEELEVHAVVVKLFKDGRAEINMITDVTLFISGTWSRTDEAAKDIELKITGSAVSNNVEGGGTLFLTEDRKGISGLKLEVLNKISHKVIKAEFVAK